MRGSRKPPRPHRVMPHDSRYSTSIRAIGYARGSGFRCRTPPSTGGKNVQYNAKGMEENIVPNTGVMFMWGSPDKSLSQEVWMPPKQFLSLVSPPPGGKMKASSLEWFDKKYLDGSEVMIAPFLSVDHRSHQIIGHEGRHRAYWLLLRGASLIPITIYLKNEAGKYVKPREQIDLSKLKPDEGVASRGSAYSTAIRHAR